MNNPVEADRTDNAAEQALLGAMIMDANAIPAAVEHLTPRDMFRPAHETIMALIIDEWEHGRPIDPVTLAGRLDDTGVLKQAGGAPYIHTLIQATPVSANIEYYAKRLANLAALRRLDLAAKTIMQTVATTTDADEALEQAQQAVAGAGRTTSKTVLSLKDVFDTCDVIPNDEQEATGTLTPTGHADLDQMLVGGLRGGQMVIVAARPGVGKSTLAVDMVRHTAIDRGKPAVVFSLEMSAAETAQRIVSAEGSIALKTLRSGRFDDSDASKLFSTMERIENAPLYIDDAANLTMHEIRAKARTLNHKTGGLGLIVVDYLQLLTSGRRVESRQQEVSGFSRQLKLLAKELDVPVVAISQLNRGVEQRGDDATPRLSDLRESGSLEQDADIVVLIHRPDSQNPDHARAGEADFLVAKHRGGQIGTVTVANQLQFCRFTDMAGMFPTQAF
ncbi:replicative DNA helicase [Corynebacterium evansiae]|uniref:replicative DNA helicase n=1 Tax=Corynebacterium evansiae TaxID=2913499 RepID=UPI003EBC204F